MNANENTAGSIYSLSSEKFFMEYTVIKKTDASELVTEVNDRIAKGWKPAGGISIAFGRIRNTTGNSKAWIEVLFHVQAMIKE